MAGHSEGSNIDSFLNGTIKLAHQGEDRARSLDVVGWVLVIVALVTTAGAVTAILTQGDELDNSDLTAIIAGGIGTVIACFVTAAVFFGFATLVRNSSRLLELAVLDSSLLELDADPD